MSTWGFSRESTQTAAGANTQAAIVKGYQPHYEADSMASKRNIIATSAGWVRRQHKTDTHGNVRVQDEIVVSANPGVPNKDYTSNTYLGNSDVCQMYIKLNANGYISANVSANLYVVFNTPVAQKASGNNATINLANTTGGNSGVAIFSNTATARITNANNTLVFVMPPLQGGAGSVAAVYQINAQSIGITGGGNSLYNPDDGATAAANLVITGATANNLLDGAGTRIVTFSVARPAGQV